jgi:hypothetical protein
MSFSTNFSEDQMQAIWSFGHLAGSETPKQAPGRGRNAEVKRTPQRVTVPVGTKPLRRKTMTSKLGSFLAGLGKTAFKAFVVTIFVILAIVAAGGLMRWMIFGNHKSATLHGQWSFGGPTVAGSSRSSKHITRPRNQVTGTSNPCAVPAITSQMQPGNR